MCALTAATLFIGLRIEYLNARAGFYLPRELPEEGNPKWRWGIDSEEVWKSLCYKPMSLAEPEMTMARVWPLSEEDRLFLLKLLDAHAAEFSAEEREAVKSAILADTEPSNEGRMILKRLIQLTPMSAEVRARMEREVRQAQKDNRLHEAVETGLLQYLLAPIAWIVACAVMMMPLSWRYRVLATGCLAGASVSIALMLYRGYFQSLGW